MVLCRAPCRIRLEEEEAEEEKRAAGESQWGREACCIQIEGGVVAGEPKGETTGLELGYSV